MDSDYHPAGYSDRQELCLMFIKNPQTRVYLYSILIALGAVALVYGWVTNEQLAVWVALGGAILGNGLALANVDKQRDTGKK